MFEFLKRILNFFRREKSELENSWEYSQPEVEEVSTRKDPPTWEPIRSVRRSQQRHRPIGSFTGPGMRKLRRSGRSTRHHEKSMGIDHNLSMRDVEDKKRRR